MQIAITGTRGIPNRYGGFERFAERLSVELAGGGHEVYVYNPHHHPYREKEFRGVGIIRKPSLEKCLGAAANYLYDLRCMKDAIRRKPDVILECGYASASPWYPLLNRRGTRIVTHMDGMEWKRAKWGFLARRMFRVAESTAVRHSDSLVCDHPLIADYYREKYSVRPETIGYGADIRQNWDAGRLDGVGLRQGTYYLLLARLEPENNIRTVIEGYLAGKPSESLVILGDHTRGYGARVFRAYSGNPAIRFLGGLYEQELLDHLRHFSLAVIHGHSTGGTNPSLLENMAAGALVIAHDNPFNRWVLEDNALYFSTGKDLKTLFTDRDTLESSRPAMIPKNLSRIRESYRWKTVAQRYERLFERMCGKGD